MRINNPPDRENITQTMILQYDCKSLENFTKALSVTVQVTILITVICAPFEEKPTIFCLKKNSKSLAKQYHSPAVKLSCLMCLISFQDERL